MSDRIQIINNLFSAEELVALQQGLVQGKWELQGASVSHYSKNFWYKNLIETSCYSLFAEKIQKNINKKIIINELYVNGQAHGQCGGWHTDQVPNKPHNDYTIVYFLNEWKPYYGGHLLIDVGNVISILPEFNKGVLFESSEKHIGLEPTFHCMTQRESIACKFKVLV